MRISIVKANLSGQNNKPRNHRFVLRSSGPLLVSLGLLLAPNGYSFLAARDNGEFEGIFTLNKWADRQSKGMVPIPSRTSIGDDDVDQCHFNHFSFSQKDLYGISEKFDVFQDSYKTSYAGFRWGNSIRYVLNRTSYINDNYEYKHYQCKHVRSK